MKLSYRMMQDLTVDVFEKNRICVFTQLRYDAKGPRRLPQKLNHALIKTARRIKSELSDLEETDKAALLEFVKTDKDGAMKPDKDGKPVFKSKKAESDYNAKSQELLDTKVDVDVHQVTEATIALMDSTGGMESHLYNALADAGLIAGLEPEEDEEEDAQDEEEADEEASP